MEGTPKPRQCQYTTWMDASKHKGTKQRSGQIKKKHGPGTHAPNAWEKISQIFSSQPRNRFEKNLCWDLNINITGGNSKESAVKV